MKRDILFRLLSSFSTFVQIRKGFGIRHSRCWKSGEKVECIVLMIFRMYVIEI